jgi:hypothetical protein
VVGESLPCDTSWPVLPLRPKLIAISGDFSTMLRSASSIRWKDELDWDFRKFLLLFGFGRCVQEEVKVGSLGVLYSLPNKMIELVKSKLQHIELVMFNTSEVRNCKRSIF